MKKTMFVLFASVIVMATACSKSKNDDSPAPHTPSPVGYWTGKYGAGSTLGLNYAVVLKNDGTMRSYVMTADKTDTATASSKGVGNWQQLGSTIKTEYFAGGYSFKTTGTANESFTSMTGNWESVGTVFAGGFTLAKQP